MTLFKIPINKQKGKGGPHRPPENLFYGLLITNYILHKIMMTFDRQVQHLFKSQHLLFYVGLDQLHQSL